jgi:hypothetical protein
MEKSNGNGRADTKRHSSEGRHDRTWTEIVQEDPVACLAIAAGLGFLLGGGARRTGGLTILTFLGQIVVREALGESVSLGDFISEA